MIQDSCCLPSTISFQNIYSLLFPSLITCANVPHNHIKHPEFLIKPEFVQSHSKSVRRVSKTLQIYLLNFPLCSARLCVTHLSCHTSIWQKGSKHICTSAESVVYEALYIGKNAVKYDIITVLIKRKNCWKLKPNESGLQIWNKSDIFKSVIKTDASASDYVVMPW